MVQKSRLWKANPTKSGPTITKTPRDNNSDNCSLSQDQCQAALASSGHALSLKLHVLKHIPLKEIKSQNAQNSVCGELHPSAGIRLLLGSGHEGHSKSLLDTLAALLWRDGGSGLFLTQPGIQPELVSMAKHTQGQEGTNQNEKCRNAAFRIPAAQIPV